MTSQSRIIELSNIISTNTNKINTYLESHNLPQPSFAINAPIQPIPSENPELEECRIKAVEASIELQQLFGGVDSLLLPEPNMSALRAISHFKIASAFPIDAEISFKDLAEKTGLYEHDLSRIIRFAISHHRVFCEPRKGFVAHSAASRRLAESEIIQSIAGMTFEDVWSAHAKTVDALTTFKKSQEPNATGFALANQTNLPFYQYLSQYPDRAKRFSIVMSSAGNAGLEFLADTFTQSSVPPNALVLDLGGSQGHVSSFLANRFPGMNFVVQDLSEVISNTKAGNLIAKELKGRVELMAHDFFDVQKELRGLDVVVIRYIFHNWSDEYCVKILRNIIPALKKGTKIFVQDHLLPEPGTLSLLKERQLRSMDMIMLTLFNSRERDVDDWMGLFASADERFKFVGARRPKANDASGVITAVWEGENDN